MRKVAVSVVVLLLTFISAQAQDRHPSAEVFGGISYLKADLPERRNFYGWGVSVAGNLSSYIGFVAEVSGNYGHIEVLPIDTGLITLSGFNADSSYHTFLFGPRLSARGEKGALFGHVLVGGVRKKALAESRLNIDIPDFPFPIPDPPDLSTDPRLLSDTGLAIAVGGGVDISASRRVAVRLVQVDYLPARLGDRWEHNLRIQAGVVFRFGGD